MSFPVSVRSERAYTYKLTWLADMRCTVLWQMKVEDGLAQREIHARMQAQQAEQVQPSTLSRLVKSERSCHSAAILRIDSCCR